MKDREFLVWIMARLEDVHKENPHKDYMHKLRAIANSIPEDHETPATLLTNSLDDLVEMWGWKPLTRDRDFYPVMETY